MPPFEHLSLKLYRAQTQLYGAGVHTMYKDILTILILSPPSVLAGAENWPTLFPIACAGLEQSPIDIRPEQTIYNPDLKDFAIWYDPPKRNSQMFIKNNGHASRFHTFLLPGICTDIFTKYSQSSQITVMGQQRRRQVNRHMSATS